MSLSASPSGTSNYPSSRRFDRRSTISPKSLSGCWSLSRFIIFIFCPPSLTSYLMIHSVVQFVFPPRKTSTLFCFQSFASAHTNWYASVTRSTSIPLSWGHTPLIHLPGEHSAAWNIVPQFGCLWSHLYFGFIAGMFQNEKSWTETEWEILADQSESTKQEELWLARFCNAWKCEWEELH